MLNKISQYILFCVCVCFLYWFAYSSDRANVRCCAANTLTCKSFIMERLELPMANICIKYLYMVRFLFYFHFLFFFSFIWIIFCFIIFYVWIGIKQLYSPQLYSMRIRNIAEWMSGAEWWKKKKTKKLCMNET